MSVFFCDTNCELWYDKAEELGIQVIHMPYTIDGTEYYYDLGKATDFHDFYERVRKGAVPITSALNPQNYLDYFRPFFEQGEDIFYVSFSHHLSGTFDSMQRAVEELQQEFPERKFTCFDSRSISMGTGLLVYEAAKQHKAGMSDADLLAHLENFAAHSSAYFTVDDLHHLKRGGRIGGAAAVFGSILGIKPMLMITKEGKIENYAKAKGRKKSIEMLLDKAEELEIDLAYPISVLDADDPDGALLAEQARERFGDQAILWPQSVGPVIGTHCGPGTLGFCFTHKKDKDK